MTTTIRVQNVNSWLITTDRVLKDKLHKSLRFRDQKCYHNPAYQQGKWDGFKEFFNMKNGSFLTGLLPEVEKFIADESVDYTIFDERENNISWLYPSIDANFLDPWLPEGFTNFSLRDYQPDFVNRVMTYHRGLVQAPTGAGKTFIMISILKSLPPKTPVLFLTKNKGLVHQNYKEMIEWGVENVGQWYGNYKKPNYITCANANMHTLNSLKPLLPKIKVLIVDEVHECMSDVPMLAYKRMKKACVRVGISATPFKKDVIQKYQVKGYFGPIFKTSTTKSGYLTTKELQDRGILSSSICTFYKINEPDITYEPYIDAVTLGIAENYHLHKVIKRLDASLKGRTLILVERRDQGEYLKQLMPHAYWVNGSDSLEARQPAIEALRTGENVTAIVMRQIITAGIDVKIHNLINAAGGDADHNVIQQIGRGLRCAKDKDVLRYYDFIFEINEYLYKHSKNRMKILKNQGHEVIVKDEHDF